MVLSKSSPIPTFRGLTPKHVSPSRPFLDRPEEATILFQFSSRGSRSLSLVVHRKFLLGNLSPKENWLDGEVEHTLWEEWGTGAALFDTTSKGRFTAGGTQGQRCLFSHRKTSSGPPYSVLDFNSYRVRQAPNSRTPTLHIAGSLPYTVTELPESWAPRLFYMSGTALLGVNVRKATLYRYAAFLKLSLGYRGG